MLQPGSILENRYKIVRPLGQGGMGAVYEAVDQRFGTPVAVKEVLVELGANPDEGKRKMVRDAFEREAKALANARHEAVPFVRDYFSESDSEFLVMELVEGEELAEMLSNRATPFPVDNALDWMDQLLDALDYLHTITPPIVHRDIKPQNLKLNSRGRVKLLDFGIAKSIDAGSATVTSHTFLAATLNYSPIEQIIRVIDPTFREFILLSYKQQGEEVLSQATDARCDIYALGATFYHLLTNTVPVDATKRAVEVWSGKPDPLAAPNELNPSISPELSSVLLRAMAISREDRFGSANEMREAIPSGMPKTFAQSDALTISDVSVPTLDRRDKDLVAKMKAETEHLAGGAEQGGTVAGPTINEAPMVGSDPPATVAVDAETFGDAGETKQPSVNIDTGGSSASIPGSLVADNPGNTVSSEAGDTAVAGSPSLLKKGWILPAAGGIGALLGAIFLGAVWLMIPAPEPSNTFSNADPAANAEVLEQTATPVTGTSPEEQVLERPTSTPTPTLPKTATPVPTVTRGPRIVAATPKPTKKPTPRPARATPAPTPKRKLTDDCIYNGRCG